MATNDERTPVRTLYGVARVEEQLSRIEEHSRNAANNSLAANAKVDALVLRVRAIELTHVWFPYVLAVCNAAATLYLWSVIQSLTHR